ncbi:MAG: hypothetical protein KBD64_00985, partial [Gammaproteobacteria bacterium]|nr:hypothetical protein [Gammaproteobacteria bacterium]
WRIIVLNFDQSSSLSISRTIANSFYIILFRQHNITSLLFYFNRLSQLSTGPRGFKAEEKTINKRPDSMSIINLIEVVYGE